MLFQTLDDKKNCVAIYKEGSLGSSEITKDLTHTWTASAYLKGLPIEYAYLYCQQGLKDVCPEHLRTELEESLGLLRAFTISMSESKIDTNQHCFYDLVPD